MEKGRIVAKLRADEEIKIGKNGLVYVVKKFDKHVWARNIVMNIGGYEPIGVDFKFPTDRVTVCSAIDEIAKPGIAIRSVGDENDIIIGKAIAYCRLRNVRIPKEIFED